MKSTAMPAKVFVGLLAIGAAAYNRQVGFVKTSEVFIPTLISAVEIPVDTKSEGPRATSMSLNATASEDAQRPALQSSQALPRPVFNNMAANEYIQTYDDYISEVKSSFEAMKTGDVSKYQDLIHLTQNLEQEGAKLEGRLSPADQKRLSEYLARRADEIQEFTNQNR